MCIHLSMCFLVCLLFLESIRHRCPSFWLFSLRKSKVPDKNVFSPLKQNSASESMLHDPFKSTPSVFSSK